MKVETSYQDKPVLIYWYSLKPWSSSIGMFVVRERVYTEDGQWTALIKIYKRYPTWLGYFFRNKR